MTHEYQCSGLCTALASAVLLIALTGCAAATIWMDPKTGQVQQCTSTMPPTLPLLVQADIDKCGQTLERMGWKKQ